MCLMSLYAVDVISLQPLLGDVDRAPFGGPSRDPRAATVGRPLLQNLHQRLGHQVSLGSVGTNESLRVENDVSETNRTAGDVMNSYGHSSALGGATKQKKVEPRKIIVYSCNKQSTCGGWADRQKGVVAAFVLSVLTQRDFRLEMPRPCEIGLYLTPNKVDWRLRPNYTANATTADLNALESLGHSFVHRLLKQDDPNLMPELRQDLVYVTSNRELVHLLRRHRLANAVPWLLTGVSLSSIYRHVLNTLFSPVSGLQDKLVDFIMARPPGTKLACAQVRLGGSSSSFKDSETFNSMVGVRHLINFMSQFNHSYTYRIFFAADSVAVLDLAKRSFPETFMEASGPITHVDKTQGREACAGLGRAILDQQILATCDVLVISESGLGRIASFLRDTDDELYLFTNMTVKKYKREESFPYRIWW